MDGETRALIKDIARLAALLAAVSTAASVLNLHNWAIGGTTILWPTTALLTAHILCSPRKRLPFYLLTGFLVDLGVNTVLTPGRLAVYASGCNTLESTIASLLLYPVVAPRPDIRERRQFVALLFYGMLLAPGVTVLLASFAEAHGQAPSGLAQSSQLRGWFLADALGMATVLPLYLSYRTRRAYTRRSWPEILAHCLLLVAATVAAFGQNRYPLLFLIIPCLLPLGIRLGLAASALGLALVATIGGVLTAYGMGPAAQLSGLSVAQRDTFLQLFVAIAMMTLYLLEVITSESRTFQSQLRESEARFRLIAESSRDLIVLSELDGRRYYVSPAARAILGWEPDEMLGLSFRTVVHPDDLEKYEAMLRNSIAGLPTRTLAYRCRTRSGNYIWLENNPQIYRDPITGEPAGIVNVARDITDRMEAEEELKRAFRLVESLAALDSLTGLANRRRFDEILELEWQRAERTGSKVSLLMLDVDQFKRYNDIHGHLVGDECLRRIADAIRMVVTRATDLVARYGGEEFSVILPDTDEPGALAVAAGILEAVRQCGIEHPANPHTVVTVSAGCATVTARRGISRMRALQAADEALYRAKALGGNRVENAQVVETT